MKTISSKEAQNAFGSFLDTVQHEPVVVTKRNRPVWVMLSMDNVSAIFDIADSMRNTIYAWVRKWLEEADRWETELLDEAYIEWLKQEVLSEIKS